MIPAGYMAKRIADTPAPLEAAGVDLVFSVSGCISSEFADYVDFFQHNALGFFDAPETIRRLAATHALDLAGTRLFYYELHEEEFDAEGRPQAIAELPADAMPPAHGRLVGFDVVTFSTGYLPECSPLTCNALAATMTVNRYGLFDTFEEALAQVRSGAFANSEPGPYRVIAVHLVENEDWPEETGRFGLR